MVARWLESIENCACLWAAYFTPARGPGTIKLSTGTPLEAGRNDVLNIVGPPGNAAKQVKLSQGPPSYANAVVPEPDRTFHPPAEPLEPNVTITPIASR